LKYNFKQHKKQNNLHGRQVGDSQLDQ